MVPSPSGTLKSAATTLRGSDGSGTTAATIEAEAVRSRTEPPAVTPRSSRSWGLIRSGAVPTRAARAGTAFIAAPWS